MSFWGTLGHWGLKASEIGSLAIPGAGPFISMGLAGVDAATSKKKSSDPNAANNSNQPGSIDPYTALLQKQAGSAQAQGEQSNAMGTDALAPVMKYLQSVLSGNPGDVLDATRVDRGRVIDQYDTARKAIANFGPRGGGTTGAAAQSRFDQASSLADITSSARRDAVATEGELGMQLKQLGLTSEQLASTDLNSVINAVLNKQYLDVQKRGQNAGLLSGLGEAAGTIIGAVLTRKKA